MEEIRKSSQGKRRKNYTKIPRKVDIIGKKLKISLALKSWNIKKISLAEEKTIEYFPSKNRPPSKIWNRQKKYPNEIFPTKRFVEIPELFYGDIRNIFQIEGGKTFS